MFFFFFVVVFEKTHNAKRFPILLECVILRVTQTTDADLCVGLEIA